ncbi:SET domain-containing protein [Sorangium sp. So ce131]|uniref:SET domain-containing protein n=1 Tax=Sorangium sp. So ce131 TaxID=3133282 RepID=UPI003F5F5129
MTKLSIGSSEGRGLGVFARAPIAQGETVERTPVIVLPDPQWELLEKTSLHEYYFLWGEDAVAIATGFGMLYNHTSDPNARLVRHVGSRELEVVAVRDIAQGEEVTVHYESVWFPLK